MKVAALFGRPKVLRNFHLVAFICWGILIPITVSTNLKDSITWIALMSVWANFVGHFSSYQASRVEVLQDERIKENACQIQSTSTEDSSTPPYGNLHSVDDQSSG